MLPEGDDERVLKAAARLIDAHVVELTLIGEKEKINNGKTVNHVINLKPN